MRPPKPIPPKITRTAWGVPLKDGVAGDRQLLKMQCIYGTLCGSIIFALIGNIIFFMFFAH